MVVHVGTSGFSYREWKGKFYPKDQSAAGMLGFYAGKLDTVEINNSFYRLPPRKAVAGWAAQVPTGFRFALKAPQRITHQKRLKGVADTLARFVGLAAALDGKLGPLLFQLHPSMKKDAPRLDRFLARLRSRARAAFEFRHASWFDAEIYEILRTHSVALCAAESDELASPVVATTDWGYVRLRRTDYTGRELRAWATTILAQPWKEAFVYVKHDEGDAPKVAAKLRDLLRVPRK